MVVANNQKVSSPRGRISILKYTDNDNRIKERESIVITKNIM